MKFVILAMSALYLVLAAGITTTPAQAQTLEDLYLFNRLVEPQNGYGPRSALFRDQAGNLYGTTGYGGNLACDNTGRGCGIIFKLDTSGNLTILHSFAGGAGGALPYAGLIRDAQGNLYGTTYGDDFGAGCTAPNGCGTVFKLDKAGNFTILHQFQGTDGASPSAGLIGTERGIFTARPRAVETRTAVLPGAAELFSSSIRPAI